MKTLPIILESVRGKIQAILCTLVYTYDSSRTRKAA